MSQVNKLGRMALVGFIACWGSYYLFQTSMSKTLISSQVCKEAMELVNKHKGAKYFLGEPIEPMQAKFCTDKMGNSKHTVQVFVSGEKSKGEVFFGLNETGENQVELGTIHLQIGRDTSKKLEIKP